MIDQTTSNLPPTLPTLHIGAQYTLEKEDPLHRDGRALHHLKTKFDKMLHKHPHSHWKGQFWTWLESELKHKPLSPTRYFNEMERESVSPTILQGRLYKKKGSLIASKEVMFVIDSQKNIYVKRKKDAQSPRKFSYNHASFLSGDPVISAGKITLNHKGEIVAMKNASGHYRPGCRETVVALKVFQEKGISIKDIKVTLHGNGLKHPMKGSAFLKQFEKTIYTIPSHGSTTSRTPITQGYGESSPTKT